MKIKFKYFLIPICIIFLAVNCTKKETKYDLPSGTIVGFVKLYDSSQSMVGDKSGVEAVLEGSDPQIITTTDANGKYTFDNVSAGTYNLLLKKTGYYEHYQRNIQFAGGPAVYVNNYVQSLYQSTNVGVTNLELSVNNFSIYNEIDATADLFSFKPGFYYYFHFFVSNDPNVSYNNYIEHTTLRVRDSIADDVYIDTVLFPHGSNIYVIAYPACQYYGSSYIDLNTGKEIYSNISFDRPSNVATIAIP